MARNTVRAFQVLLLSVGAVASAETSRAVPRSGAYSLRLVAVRSTETSNEAGDKQPTCGDEGRAAFDSISQLTLVFNAAKGTAVVNGEEWTVLKGRTRTVAAKQLTKCTSFSLGLRSQESGATGLLLYVSRCPERTACASVADYSGTFSSQ